MILITSSTCFLLCIFLCNSSKIILADTNHEFNNRCMSDGAATSGTSNLDDGNHGNGRFLGNPNFVSQDSFKHRYEYDNDFYLSNFFEYEQGNAEPLVRGRMKSNIQFWIDIGAPDEILNVIRHGYKIPMFATPAPRHF